MQSENLFDIPTSRGAALADLFLSIYQPFLQGGRAHYQPPSAGSSR